MAQSKLVTKAIWDMVYYLVDRGIEIINNARISKTTGNISGTQYDSYGLAVFYNGKLYYSLKSADPSKDLTSASRFIETFSDERGGRHRGYGNIPDGTGREWANMFVDEIKKSNYISDKGFVLIVFNAAFYSSIQENKQGYQILSQVAGDMKALKSEFKSSGATLSGINISIS